MPPCQRGTRTENKKRLFSLSFSLSLSHFLTLSLCICAIMFMCGMCEWVHACVQTCMCVSVCLSQKSLMGVVPQEQFACFVFETEHLTVAWGRWLPRLIHQGTLPSQCRDCRCLLPYLPFYISFGDQTLHVCFKHFTDPAICLASGLYFQSVAFSVLGSHSRI